jgi:hypothetical protein
MAEVGGLAVEIIEDASGHGQVKQVRAGESCLDIDALLGPPVRKVDGSLGIRSQVPGCDDNLEAIAHQAPSLHLTAG